MIEFTTHAKIMLQERGIPLEWIERTIEKPHSKETNEDGTIHYLMPIPEHGGRILRVIVNPQKGPFMVVTMFFDRRLGRQL